GTTEDRMRRQLIKKFAGVPLQSITPDHLQSVLEEMADEGYTKNTVSHVRWDMNQIFRYAMDNGFVERNPAANLFVPRNCVIQEVRAMTFEEVNRGLAVLPLRERLIYKLAILSGMRVGEILALRRDKIAGVVADIRERVYKCGDVDTPKT